MTPTQRKFSQKASRWPARRGSALLVVIVLLAMLASLGVIFFMFAAQERTSSTFYSDAAKIRNYDSSVEDLMEAALEQLILGPAPDDRIPLRNSALYGRVHSLMGNMLGLDSTSNGAKFDFSPYNGTPFDSSQSNEWQINDSPVAHNGNDPTYTGTVTPNQRFPLAHRDPDYTYPDLNNVFLSYDGYVQDLNSGIVHRVIIPSFHRPQSPNLRGNNNWFGASIGNGLGAFVLRPNRDHQYIPPSGRGPTAGVNGLRFLDDATAQAAWGNQTMGFPFVPPRNPALSTSPGGTRSLALGQQGVWSLTGTPPYTVTGDHYEGDVDNDGDGVWEGVWLDLDLPPQETPTGELYVPLVSFTVKDADGLLNLNVHGNLASVWAGDTQMSSPFVPGNNALAAISTHDGMVSRSNLGLTPSEVNPLWAFNRRPQTQAHISQSSNHHDGDYDQPTADVFFTPSAKPTSWYETANRDFLYLVMGRYTPSPIDLVPGRWGEDDLLYLAITNNSTRNPALYAYSSGGLLSNPWPGPGQTRVDDNGDAQRTTGGFYGSAFTPFGQPMDYTGLGQYFNTTGNLLNKGKTLLNPGNFSLARWPRFTRYTNASQYGVTWPTLTSSISDVALFNDPAEVVLDADNPRPEDNFFGADEMRALHLSSTDFANFAGGSSRLTNLARFNLDATNTTFPSSDTPARNTQEFRSKFTTRSWDRKQFSLRYDATRAWEFSADADGDQRGEFPPYFGVQPYGSSDPFRPLLRKLLEVEHENTDQARFGLRLNLNQLLVGPNGNPYPTFQMPPNGTLPPNIQLHYRPLTPHPDPATLPAAAITNFGLNSYPANGNFSGNVRLQEYWARVDRQLLARDLFMLLYVSVWPDDIDPTQNAVATGSNGQQEMIRQMAQFAVNVVDSLDRDNIITRFAYDTNPTNGWSVDDYPYAGLSNPERAEVWGVERLDLTLSEALAVQTEAQTADASYTQWDDTQQQFFSYVELRNPGPNTVNLSNRAWLIEVGPDYATASPTDYPLIRRLQLRQGSIAAGELFTIGSTNHALSGMHPSVMKVDYTKSGNTDWDNDQNLWVAPRQRPLDLDLKNSSQSAQYSLLDATGSAPASGALYGFVGSTSDGSDQIDRLYFRLYRRVNPDRPIPNSQAEEDDNPLVLVDEIAIDDMTDFTMPSGSHAGKLNINNSTAATDVEAHLRCLQSRERAQPFSGNFQNGYRYNTQTGSSSQPPFANTLDANNANSPPYFRDWQRVFDRDFASVGELLQLTLGGFYRIDTGSGRGTKPLPGFVTSLNTSQYWNAESNSLPGNPSVPTINGTAEALFLPFSTGPSIGASDVVPRWHRFLEFVEVPTRMHAGIAGFTDPLDYPRVPGKINLNMLRHPDALAALIDDPSIMRLIVDEDLNLDGQFTPGSGDFDFNNDGQLSVLHPPQLMRLDNQQSGATTPTTEVLNSWWHGLIAARDGLRMTSGGMTADSTTGLFLPGLPGSVPFRSYTAANGFFPLGQTSNSYRVGSVEKSLLRSWPEDDILANAGSGGSPPPNPRQLFEVGTIDEHRGVDSGNSEWTQWNTAVLPDPYARRRILNKIMNNSTNRSNVFVVFISIKYFRALVNPTSGAVQIGGPLAAFQDPSGLSQSPPVPPDRTDPGWLPEHRGFFVIDRSQLEKAYDRGTGKIDYRPLVEFRQIFH